MKILQPLLKEMAELGESLDEDEFVDSCKNLLKSLNYADKQKLLKFRIAHVAEEK